MAHLDIFPYSYRFNVTNIFILSLFLVINFTEVAFILRIRNRVYPMHQHNLSLVFYNRLIQHQRRANPNGGMSLIEILVVVALTALLAAFAAPAITFGTNPLKDSSNRIAASFKWARAQAMASTSAVRIRPISNTQFVMERARRCTEANAANWTIISDRVEKNGQMVYEDLSFDTPAQLTLPITEDGTAVTPTTWDICFNSRGLADKTVVLTMQDTDTNQQRTMTVFLGGTVDLSAIN